MDIYQDVMPNTGTFYITVGYRLGDRTLVTSDEEIEVTVNPPVVSTSTGVVPAGNWECLPGGR